MILPTSPNWRIIFIGWELNYWPLHVGIHWYNGSIVQQYDGAIYFNDVQWIYSNMLPNCDYEILIYTNLKFVYIQTWTMCIYKYSIIFVCSV
jgi:hypothetical protein